MRVTAPVAGFAGVVVGVVFTDGVGHTSDATALGYFRRRGYTVEPDSASSRAGGTPSEPLEIPQKRSDHQARKAPSKPRRKALSRVEE